MKRNVKNTCSNVTIPTTAFHRKELTFCSQQKVSRDSSVKQIDSVFALRYTWDSDLQRNTLEWRTCCWFIPLCPYALWARFIGWWKQTRNLNNCWTCRIWGWQFSVSLTQFKYTKGQRKRTELKLCHLEHFDQGKQYSLGAHGQLNKTYFMCDFVCPNNGRF